MKKLTAWTLFLAIYLSFIGPVAVSAQAVGKARDIKMAEVEQGLKFTLSNGVEGAETREVKPSAVTDPISESEAGKLLGRLPEIKSDPDDQAEFAKRLGTLPAPKTGEKIPVKFPATESQAPSQYGDAKKALSVIRFSPEGEIPLAPDLSVTFSHPMVAVTSQEEAAKYAPVEMTPQVDGRWRWLGTRTLMFDTGIKEQLIPL